MRTLMLVLLLELTGAVCVIVGQRNPLDVLESKLFLLACALFGLFEVLTKFGQHCLLEQLLSIGVIDPTYVFNLTTREVQ